MNHLPRGHVVQDYGGRIAIGHTAGDRNEVFGPAHEKLCEASVHRKRRHTLTHFETGAAGANGLDHAGGFIPRHERHLWRVPVVSGQHEQVGRADPGSAHPHAQLPWAR